MSAALVDYMRGEHVVRATDWSSHQQAAEQSVNGHATFLSLGNLGPLGV